MAIAPLASEAVDAISRILTETITLVSTTLEAEKIDPSQKEAKLIEAGTQIEALTLELSGAIQLLAEAKAPDRLTSQSIINLAAAFSEQIKLLISSAQDVSPKGAETPHEPAPVNVVTDTGAATSY